MDLIRLESTYDFIRVVALFDVFISLEIIDLITFENAWPHASGCLSSRVQYMSMACTQLGSCNSETVNNETVDEILKSRCKTLLRLQLLHAVIRAVAAEVYF